MVMSWKPDKVTKGNRGVEEISCDRQRSRSKAGKEDSDGDEAANGRPGQATADNWDSTAREADVNNRGEG